MEKDKIVNSLLWCIFGLCLYCQWD